MANKINNLRQFGNFRLDTEKKVLWCENEPVNLPLKEIELLCVLTESNELITKDQILNRVWANSFVEESNLSRHIYRLRKTLAKYGETEDIIETVPKRGYRWKGEIVQFDNTQDLIVEKHSVTRTLIEEIDDSPEVKHLPKPTKKNLYFIPLIAISLFASALIGIFAYQNQARKISGIKTIAVARISSLSDNEEEKMLALGVKEKLLINLSNIKDLQIVNVNIDENETEKVANADAFLFGNVQKTDGKIRINMRLLQATDKKQIWAASFDENEANIFKLQDELSQNITDSLSINLTKSEREKIYKRYTENQEAYQHYIRGRFFFDKRNGENYLKAIAEFEKAIELDKNYALAYSGLADVYSMQGGAASTEKRNQVYEKALQNAQKSLEIDPNLAEPYASIAWIKRTHYWDWAESEKYFKRAIELNPNYVNARQWYAQLLAGLGRLDEALAENDKALQIEPLSKVVLANRLSPLIFSRRFDEGLALAEQLIQMDDDKRANIRSLSVMLNHLNQDERLIEIFEKSFQEKDDLKIGDRALSNLATAYFRTGRTDKANEIFAMLEKGAKTDSENAFRLAQAYSDIGKKDEAIAHLQDCYNRHDDRMVWLKVDPRFDNIRNDARFQELLRKMNLL